MKLHNRYMQLKWQKKLSYRIYWQSLSIKKVLLLLETNDKWLLDPIQFRTVSLSEKMRHYVHAVSYKNSSCNIQFTHFGHFELQI